MSAVEPGLASLVSAIEEVLGMVMEAPAGLEHGVRTVGERLFQEGGRPLMRTVAERVAGGDPVRAAYLAEAWASIGPKLRIVGRD